MVADGVMTVQWSNSSEYVLVTGGCDGAIRFWDIRRAGCFRVLDQSHSQLGRRPPLLERSTMTKVFVSCVVTCICILVCLPIKREDHLYLVLVN